MFHIEFIVDDKYLVSILRTLAEIKVHNLETKPVVNVQKKNGKLAAVNGGDTIAERLASELTSHHKDAKLSRAKIFEMIRGLGSSPSTYVIDELIETKVIRRLQRGQYKILGTK